MRLIEKIDKNFLIESKIDKSFLIKNKKTALEKVFYLCYN